MTGSRIHTQTLDTAEVRGRLIKHLEDPLALADELQDGPTGYLIERALDEMRASQFKPPGAMTSPVWPLRLAGA